MTGICPSCGALTELVALWWRIGRVCASCDEDYRYEEQRAQERSDDERYLRRTRAKA